MGLVVAVCAMPLWAKTVWVDVRSPKEFAQGHVRGAVNFPHNQIVVLAKKKGYTPNDRILLYCRSGARASVAQAALKQAGYRDVQNLGGFADLQASGAVKTN